jgi:hypothetical protein
MADHEESGIQVGILQDWDPDISRIRVKVEEIERSSSMRQKPHLTIEFIMDFLQLTAFFPSGLLLLWPKR